MRFLRNRSSNDYGRRAWFTAHDAGVLELALQRPATARDVWRVDLSQAGGEPADLLQQVYDHARQAEGGRLYTARNIAQWAAILMHHCQHHSQDATTVAVRRQAMYAVSRWLRTLPPPTPTQGDRRPEVGASYPLSISESTGAVHLPTEAFDSAVILEACDQHYLDVFIAYFGLVPCWDSITEAKRDGGTLTLYPRDRAVVSLAGEIVYDGPLNHRLAVDLDPEYSWAAKWHERTNQKAMQEWAAQAATTGRVLIGMAHPERTEFHYGTWANFEDRSGGLYGYELAGTPMP